MQASNSVRDSVGDSCFLRDVAICGNGSFGNFVSKVAETAVQQFRG
jgi:hypothetical protein